MKAKIATLLRQAIESLQQAQALPENLPLIQIQIERTREKEHGDYASNIAMILAKPAGKKPRELAELIVANLPASNLIEKAVIAGPGFINFHVHPHAYLNIIADVLEKKEQFGITNLGHNKKINIEFVSSNPTGPLHVGHGRGAAFGATLANLLSAQGYQVDKEYYVNDAGRQMHILAVSLWLRYLELNGEKFKFPKSGYQGDYLKTYAAKLIEENGQRFKRSAAEVFANVPEDETEQGGDKEKHIDALIVNAKKLLKPEDYQLFFDTALFGILDDIKQDLAEFGVTFDRWFSERSLLKNDIINNVITQLRNNGHIYEREGAIWFRSTDFGDDKDRVLIRENGQSTYFASDIAYLLNKYERNYEEIIFVFGADHHSYVTRLKASTQALKLDTSKLKFHLVQFAVLYRGEEKVQMSTRSGEFVTLRALREEVGNDAARFFYVQHKADQHMNFDLALAQKRSNENPVFYIQYAHARICSVFNQLKQKNLQWGKITDIATLMQLNQEIEKSLLIDLARYPEILIRAAATHEPHLIANYLRELASDFHNYYDNYPFLTLTDSSLRNARLSLIVAVKQVLVNGLKLLGVSAPESM